ncbi:MAG: PEP-CTERM sorting domain-containing protein [Scytonema sp. PMC 1070.18]|nr:PEP-CTERM sorting domain-containing protein [Scytonema sp. PMC 1070.18]
MKKFQGFTKCFLQLATPLIASSVLASSPSQAATLAFSEGVTEFINFSQNPLGTSTQTSTNTLAISENDQVRALANAEAFFITTSPRAFNSSVSQAVGDGRDYLGLAESEASIVGNFVVDAGTLFSFDFKANLNLETKIDSPQFENAIAAGGISFALMDMSNQSIIDFFSLAGYVETPGDMDFIEIPKSDSVTLNNSAINSNFGGNQESVTASIQGSLQRSFTNKTTFALVEVKRNQTRVTAPEPSTALALLFSGVIGITFTLKSKKQKKLQFLSV